MSRTEERLADALHASADRVRDHRLRPFPGVEPHAELSSERRAAWRSWLVPAAAAASVALVIGLAVAVTGGVLRAGPSVPASGRAGGAAAGLPPYFVELVSTRSGPVPEIRSVSTGTVISSEPPVPKVPGWSIQLDAEAAAPDGRTFYFDYDASRAVKSSVTRQLWIYRVSVTSSGSVTPLTPIRGGTISGTAALDTGGRMAVSPDGTRLALTTADTTVPFSHNSQGWPDKVIVVDLRTGLRSVWQGGLYRSGQTFTIEDISWTTNGRSLVFLALWCAEPWDMTVCGGTPGPHEYRDTQVRSLSVGTGDGTGAGTGGGTLDRSAVLLTQSARYPVIASVTAGPGAAELTAVVLSGQPEAGGAWSRVAVDRVSAANGALLGVAYQAAAVGDERQADGVVISADPSGRYQLFGYAGPGGLYTGWIGSGRLHPLPIKQPYPDYGITTW
jgi:hypothetical protein